MTAFQQLVSLYTEADSYNTNKIDAEATEPRKRHEQVEKGVSKHQAVLAIDMASWKELIDTFAIEEPLIPHRIEEGAKQVAVTGWYG
jgi:hypothetical protein